MHVGIRTHTPYATLMGMPVMGYLRYERVLVQELERLAEEREANQRE